MELAYMLVFAFVFLTLCNGRAERRFGRSQAVETFDVYLATLEPDQLARSALLKGLRPMPPTRTLNMSRPPDQLQVTSGVVLGWVMENSPGVRILAEGSWGPWKVSEGSTGGSLGSLWGSWPVSGWIPGLVVGGSGCIDKL